MIVTHSPAKDLGHVVLQKDHAAVAWQLAKAFGNQHFAGPEPRDLMEFLALNHDRGWDEADSVMPRNPATGLPYSLTQTPLDALLRTSPQSVEFNAAYHPYCGLLAGMHVWGLFNGRYGLSDKIVVSMLQGEARIKADAMLADVLERQQELRGALASDPDTAALIDQRRLMQNYKLLQFFDTVSLYFNERIGVDGETSAFLRVPMDAQRDCTITLKPLGKKVYRVSPYPFAEDGLNITHRALEIPVLDADVDYQKVFAEAVVKTELITLVA